MITAFRKPVSARSHSQNAAPLSLEAAIYLAAALAIAGFGSYRAATAATYMDAVKWSQAVSIVGQAILVWLVARLTRQRPLALLIAITGVYAASLPVQLTSISGLFFSDPRDTFFFTLPWAEAGAQPRIAFDVWRTAIDASNAVFAIWILYAFWRGYRKEERLRTVLGGAVTAGVFAANVNDMYFVDPVFLAPYGLLFMLAAFWKYPQQAVLPVSSDGDEFYPERETLEKTAGPYSPAPRSWKSTLLLNDQNPLVGTVLAMLLVSVAQLIASDTLENIVVLLVILGMMQATISALHKVGSGKWLRQLAVLALCVLGLSQVVSILQGMDGYSVPFFLETQNLLHPHVRDWLWILGLLLLLSAFYLAGVEAGESRKALVLEHGQLVAEVAERRRAEGNLRLSEERFRTLIENCTDIIAVLDANGTFLYVGASVEQILRYNSNAMVGKSVFAFCHPDDASMLRRELERVSLDPDDPARATEVRIRHGDGSWRVMEAVGKNRLADPVLNGIVINARDITERKLMAERLEFVKSEEQQRIRHDLHDTVGQDLTGLLCMAGSLSRKLQEVSDEGAKRAEAIVEGVRHTIEDVRNAIQGIAPVEADPRGLEVALNELVEKAKTQSEIDAVFDCGAPVSITDYGAATQLFRIAQEALNNAVKHAQAKRIVLSLRAGADNIALSITDDGIGMDGQARLSQGMGLHTMRSRAAAIGAVLRVSGAVGGRGACVECVLGRDRNSENAEEKGPHNFEI